MKLYQFAVLKHPTPDEKKKGKKTELLVDLTTILAPDNNAAMLIAGRAIPEEEVANLDRLEVAVRPF